MSTKILSSDIELRASERMTDATDGGGEMSAVTIIDNKINQLFGPISDSDRVAGRVNLRQAYLHLADASADTYYGANAIIDSPPTDPNVTVLLFSLGVSGASRADAKAYIENYIAIGPRSRMHPVGTQNAGQGQILAYQRSGAPLPEVGEVYVISIEGTQTSQAFKIQAVDSYTDTFAYTNGSSITDYTCTALTLTITQPLEYTFPGADPSPLMSGASWIRRSLVSNSARYFGVSKLAADVSQNAVAFTVADTQAQLLPVTTSEIPILDTPVSSVVTEISAGSHNVDVSNFGHTRADSVTQANNILNWNATLRPIPAAGTLSVAYRTGGKWYTLNADGTGAITGDSPSYGSGSLSLTSGTATVTLGSNPDIGSSIIWTWGSGVHYRLETSAAASNPSMTLELGEACVPGSLVVRYLQSTVEHSATTTTAGVISGTGVSGKCFANTGKVYLDWSILPDSASQIACDYDAVTTHTDSLYNAGWINYDGTLTPNPVLTVTPIEPGSVSMAWDVECEYMQYSPI